MSIEILGVKKVMEQYSYLLYLAVILVFTKILSILVRRLSLPQVVGALIAGLIIGPIGLNLVDFTTESGIFLSEVAEIGVIFIMFSAGLETDIHQLNDNKVASFVVACCGVLLPLIGGTLAYYFYFDPDITNYTTLLKTIFTGVVLTATSVSITVETLKEMGKLKSNVGVTILGAAIIDDILGIIILSFITSLTDTSINVGMVVVKILLYFVFIIILAIILNKISKRIDSIGIKRRVPIISIAFCFLLAYISERFFGVADITGAYFAGLMLSYLRVSDYIKSRVEIPSYIFFTPVFFACVGMKTDVSGMDASLIGFTIIFVIVAMLTKIIGCGLGARLCKFDKNSAFHIGLGMTGRGEVALIMAQKGTEYGLIDERMFAPIIIMIITTALLTPIFLKIFMTGKKKELKTN